MPNPLDPEKVCLANLAGGAALERFDFEFLKVLENVLDPNTDAKKKRKIKLTVSLTPSRDRDYATAEIACESDLASLKSFDVPIYIGIGVDGKPTARQTHFKQQTIDGWKAEQNRENEGLTSISGGKKQ